MNDKTMAQDKIDRVLGRRVTYPQTYSPGVLVAVPRQLNREGLGIADDCLPFVGEDVWHAYEVSCLTDNGLPTAGVMKISVPCESRSIVESKSLKLYLNSFNMERMGPVAAEAEERMAETVGRDLSALLGADVGVGFLGCDAAMASMRAYEDGFATLEDMPEAASLAISQYTEAPDLLRGLARGGEVRFKSHLLRSNCRVTHQPDWGDVYISVEGDETPDPMSLLQYIVSLRGENHFHEEICELIFKRLQDLLHPRALMVMCRYTRRGGIDINPVRATSAVLVPTVLTDLSLLTDRGARG